MCIGVLIGYQWFPHRWSKVNTVLQMVCIAILIFSMGVKLGSRENFLYEITHLGFSSLLFALIPIGLSVLLVYLLTEKYLKKSKKKSTEEKETW